MHEEQLKKVKEDHKSRVKQVKDVLDQQVRLRAELREKQVAEQKDFDKRILDAARREMEEEQKKVKER